MDKRRKIFQIMAAAVFITGILLYKGITDREFRIHAAETIAGQGMLRLVQAQYAGEEAPKVALTFDDGPHEKYTPVLLEGLRKRGVHATFFLIGENIQGKEEIVKQMQKDGHLIGNHTYDHVQLDQLPGDEACRQILKTNNEIYEVTGEYPLYLRPPYGAWPKNLELCVTMLPVFWDVDTLDWRSKNVQSVEEIIKQEVKDGSIILMHDCFETSVEAALETVDLLKSRGYELVTVSELLVT